MWGGKKNYNKDESRTGNRISKIIFENTTFILEDASYPASFPLIYNKVF